MKRKKIKPVAVVRAEVKLQSLKRYLTRAKKEAAFFCVKWKEANGHRQNYWDGYQMAIYRVQRFLSHELKPRRGKNEKPLRGASS